MKRVISALMSAIMVLRFCMLPALAKTAHFVPTPQTDYAREFVSKAEGQQWFIDEVERVLDTNQKSIDTLTGPDDLTIITSLGFANRGI